MCVYASKRRIASSPTANSVLAARRLQKISFSFSADERKCLAFVISPLHFLLALGIEYKKKVVMNMQMTLRDEDVDIDFTVLALAPQKL